MPYDLLMPYDLRGRCAVVTGAARGIGLAIARQLRHCGARVIAVDKDERGLKEQFDGEAGCEWVTHDLAQPDEQSDGDGNAGHALARKVLTLARERKFGTPSLVVNNAASSTPHSFLNLEPASHDDVYRVVVRTPLYMTQSLVKALLAARDAHPGSAPQSGAILFISSIHERVPARRLHYSASKAELAQIVRELAFELGPHAIRVNSISPGWIRTDPNPDSPEQQAKMRTITPRIPLRRPGAPDNVASLAVALLSDRIAGYVTGVNLPIDGGLSLDTWVPPDPDVHLSSEESAPPSLRTTPHP